jgi:hypothetical protein
VSVIDERSSNLSGKREIPCQQYQPGSALILYPWTGCRATPRIWAQLVLLQLHLMVSNCRAELLINVCEDVGIFIGHMRQISPQMSPDLIEPLRLSDRVSGVIREQIGDCPFVSRYYWLKIRFRTLLGLSLRSCDKYSGRGSRFALLASTPVQQGL